MSGVTGKIIVNKQKTDFARVLDELAERGLAEDDIARLTGVDKALLRKLRWGVRKQPGYDEGCAIMDLYNTAADKRVA